MIYTFTIEDMDWAAEIGCKRNNSAWALRLRLEEGRTDWGWDRHIIGSHGEIAVHRLTKTEYKPKTNGESDRLRGDVGPYQVKTIVHHSHNLIVRRHDPANFVYIVVLLRRQNNALSAELRGWQFGTVARSKQFWTERSVENKMHTSAYVCTELKPISSLPSAALLEAGRVEFPPEK